MHVAVVSVTINDPEAALEYLRSEIVPRVSQAPGFVTGHWYGDGQTKGNATIVWESEENANAFVEMVRGQEGPNHATIDSIEVHEVVASA
jgi:hypothetical protein